MPQDPPCFTSDSQPAGLYIHIPFCLRKCPYCDFYSITDLSLQTAFLDALASEMNMTRELDKRFDTLYIGGGTPSVLGIKTIDNIIKTAHQCFNILSNPEITLEVNPGTVTLEQLKGYRQAGVNRINMGVQSFNSANLDFLQRIHSAEEAQMAIKWAQKSGYENIGLDLIYGIPGQTTSSWLKDLHSAVDSKFGVHGHVTDVMFSEVIGTIGKNNFILSFGVSDYGVIEAVHMWMMSFLPIHNICAKSFVSK